jgi:hypothetical protein
VTGEEYRRVLGVLLAWAMVPLPFLYIIQPPFWLISAAVGVTLLVRPKTLLRLKPPALNLIGIAILVVVVLAGGLRVGPLRPLGHLLLLLTSVRVLMVDDRRSFLRALLLVFLAWLVAVASSTHFSVMFYFAASAFVWWWLGMRIHLDGVVGTAATGVLRLSHVAVAAAAALVLTIPLFLIMPRLSSPWIAGRGGTRSVTGFSSQVDLAGVGPIHPSHEVAVVVRSTSGETIRPGWMRLRGTAMERVTLDTWAPRGATGIPRLRDGLIWLHDQAGALDDAVELEVELLHPRRYLFLPQGTVALACPHPVRLDPTGGVVLASRIRGPLRYRVWVSRGAPPGATDRPLRRPPRFQPPDDIRLLAQEIVVGLDSDRAKAAAVEAYLRENYGYSMSGMARMGPDPVAWFLLNQREGHCEYFAGAMVVLLRELGIPARMVAGYSGGSLSASGDEAVVREVNAHAWVEAWVGPDKVWTVFDPTPASEVPALDRPTFGERLRWAWDWTGSRWDRYVLTFGFGEQIGLVTAAADGVVHLVRGVDWRRGVWILLLIAAIAAIAAFIRRRRHPRRTPRQKTAKGPAAAAVEKLARRLQSEGTQVPPSATVRWIANGVRTRWPTAGAAAGELAYLAERELYSGAVKAGVDHTAVHKLWVEARRNMKPTSRR